MIGRPRPDYLDRMMTAGVVIFATIGMATTGRYRAIAFVMVVAIELSRLVVL